MAIYESEHTRFMREWLQTHPEQIEEASKGRSLWWDKTSRDLDSQRRDEQSKVQSMFRRTSGVASARMAAVPARCKAPPSAKQNAGFAGVLFSRA